MMWFPRVHHDRLPAAVSNLEPSEDRVSHEQTPYNAQDVDPELILPKLPSLIIMIAANIFLQISFYIIVSSSNDYSIYLGGDSTFSGLVIGIVSLFSGLALYPMSKIDGGGYKIPLHVSCVTMSLGHVLYALAYRANYLYLILIGRIVNGLGFTLWMYCKRYCSDPRIVGVRRRTTLASWLVIGQGVGMSLGPFAGGLLYKIGFKNDIFNGFTSPAWIMAVVWAAFWVTVTFWFEDIPLDRRAYDQPLSPASVSTASDDEKSASDLPTLPLSVQPLPYRMSYRQWGVVACMCWASITAFFILDAWVSNLAVFGAATPDFHWSPFAAGNFIALGGITIFPFLILNLILARRIEDRKILAVGSLLGVSGLLVFLVLLESQKLNYESVFMCWWAVALGFNLASTVTISILSKQLPSSWNGRTSLAIQYSNLVGGVIGAIWGGSGVRVGMSNYVGVQIAFVGIGAVIFVPLWQDLRTKMG